MTNDNKTHKSNKSKSNKSTSNKSKSIVKDYTDLSTDTDIDFTITLNKGWLNKLENEQHDGTINGIEKVFKLVSYCSTSNMHLFDAQENLKKYETISDIIDEYYIVRMGRYQTRKECLMNSMEKEIIKISNKVRYIREILIGTIDLRNKNRKRYYYFID